jgi:hypothetical protein
MREAYRLNKHLLYEKVNQPVLLHINYLSKDILPYQTIADAMIKGIQKINL